MSSSDAQTAASAPPAGGPHLPAGEPRSRAERIKRIIDDLTARCAAGETVKTTLVADEHPDLMPELGEQLLLVSMIQLARDEAAGRGAERGTGRRRARRRDRDGLRDGSRDGSGDSDWDRGLQLDARAEDRLLRGAIADYDLGPRLRQGGQGIVYRATERRTGRVVAIKVMLAAAASSPAQRRRFECEVEIACKLEHPGIVPILDSGEALGRPWFVMDFIDGRPIDEYAQLEQLSVRRRVELILHVCRAVSHAHQRGIIHRDLKPANILVAARNAETSKRRNAETGDHADSSLSTHDSSLASGSPKVLDFGLAKELFEDDADRTRISITGQIMGTLQYLSPEQAAGRTNEVDVRSDIYALGVVLFELLTGVFPYPVLGSRNAVCDAICNQEPKRPRQALAGRNPPDRVIPAEITDDLQSIVGRALEKSPEQRYASAAALADDLDRWLGGKTVSAHSGRTFYLMKKTLRRHRGVAIVSAVALLALGGMAGWLTNVIWEKRAAVATRNARADWANAGYKRMFSKGERTRKGMRPVAELAALPAKFHDAHLKRYQHIIEEDQGLTALIEGMPEEPERATRSPDPEVRAPAEAWLAESSARLDEISTLLSSATLMVPLSPAPLDNGSFPDNFWVAGQVVRAFVARAYTRLDLSDPAAGLADLTAANRLAMDIADGGTFTHKITAVKCRRLVYRFLLEAMSDALRAGAPFEDYLNWIEADPIVAPLADAWQHELTWMLIKSQDWFVTDATGKTERLNLDLVQGNYERHPKTDDWLATLHRNGAGRLTREEAERELDAFVESARNWEQLTYPELESYRSDFNTRVLERSAHNPVIDALAANNHVYYALRLRTCALRNAVRLVAYAVRFRDLYGRWPSRLEGAMPQESTGDLIDPLTGTAFKYDVVDDLPLIRSQWIENLFVRTDQRGPWIADGDDRAIYFPSPAPGP